MPVTIDVDAEIDSIRMAEQGSDPATPDAGYRHVYAKADGIYEIDDADAITGPFIDASTYPTFSGARYTSDAGTAIASGSAAIVNFEDVDYDPGSAVTTGASWKYTAPATGYYHIASFISFQSSAAWALGERILMTITIDTVDKAQIARWEAPVTATLIPSVGGSVTIYLTSGQYISLTINQNSGSNLSITASALACWISIDRIG